MRAIGVAFLSAAGEARFVATFYVTIRHGYFWGKGGMEVPLYLLLVSLALLIRGGGRLSADRRLLGREI